MSTHTAPVKLDRPTVVPTIKDIARTVALLDVATSAFSSGVKIVSFDGVTFTAPELIALVGRHLADAARKTGHGRVTRRETAMMLATAGASAHCVNIFTNRVASAIRTAQQTGR